jgi:hypothetical protein
MKQVVMLCYANASNRLYALCEDGSIFHKSELKPDSPWVEASHLPEAKVTPPIKAPELEAASDLPKTAPSEPSGITGMLGEAPKAEPQPIAAQGGSTAFLAPGQVPVESPKTNGAMPIIPHR